MRKVEKHGSAIGKWCSSHDGVCQDRMLGKVEKMKNKRKFFVRRRFQDEAGRANNLALFKDVQAGKVWLPE